MLQLDPVAAHSRQRAGRLDAHRYVADRRIAHHQPRHFRHHLVEIERDVLEVALLEEQAQSLDHVGRALVVGDDVVQDLAHLHDVDHLGGKEALGHLGVVQDRRQRLIQLMGQRRGELPQGGDATDVRHLLPEPLRLELDLPARECVGEHASEELESLDRLVRLPGALAPDGAEHEAAHDDSPDEQRQGDLGLDAAGATAAPIHRRVVRQLLEP